MSFELTLASEGAYAILTNYEDVTRESAVERQRAMLAFSLAHGISRFLIDTRGRRYTGGNLDLYTFARQTLHAEGFDITWKVALVTSHDDGSHDFLETVSQNVGYQVVVFKDYDEGLVWLTKFQSPSPGST